MSSFLFDRCVILVIHSHSNHSFNTSPKVPRDNKETQEQQALLAKKETLDQLVNQVPTVSLEMQDSQELKDNPVLEERLVLEPLELLEGLVWLEVRDLLGLQEVWALLDCQDLLDPLDCLEIEDSPEALATKGYLVLQETQVIIFKIIYSFFL